MGLAISEHYYNQCSINKKTPYYHMVASLLHCSKRNKMNIIALKNTFYMSNFTISMWKLCCFIFLTNNCLSGVVLSNLRSHLDTVHRTWCIKWTCVGKTKAFLTVYWVQLPLLPWVIITLLSLYGKWLRHRTVKLSDDEEYLTKSWRYIQCIRQLFMK